jgi:hypothetical protein
MASSQFMHLLPLVSQATAVIFKSRLTVRFSGQYVWYLETCNIWLACSPTTACTSCQPGVSRHEKEFVFVPDSIVVASQGEAISKIGYNSMLFVADQSTTVLLLCHAVNFFWQVVRLKHWLRGFSPDSALRVFTFQTSVGSKSMQFWPYMCVHQLTDLCDLDSRILFNIVTPGCNRYLYICFQAFEVAISRDAPIISIGLLLAYLPITGIDH